MHSTSLFVAALVAAASLATAETENRPKIYFPRHVKRQYTNHTITSSASRSIQSDTVDSTTHSETKKDSISDLLSSLLSGIDPSESTTTTSSDVTSASSSISASSTSESESESQGTATTSDASSSASTSGSSGSVGSTGGVPPLISLPTLSLDLPSLLPTSDAETASVSANSTVSATGTATGTTAEVSTTGEATNGTAIETASDSTAVPSTTVPSSSSGILIAPTGVVTQSSTSSSGGLLGGVTSLVGGVTSAVGGVTSAVLPTASASANATESSTELGTDASSAITTSSDGGLLPSLSLLPSSLSLFPTTTFPGTAPTASSTSSSTAPLLSLPPLLGTGSSSSSASSFATTSSETPLISLPPLFGTGSSSIAIPTSIANTTDSTILPTVLPTESLSLSLPLPTPTVIPSNTTTSSVEPVTTPVTSPTVPLNTTTSATEVPITQSSSSSVVTVPLNTTTPLTSSAERTTVQPTSTSSSTVYSTSVAPSTTSSSTTAPIFTSIPVIGTITDSQSWLPTTIIVQPSTSTFSTTGQPTATGIPTSLPKAITPWTASPAQPPDTTLIQISFLFGENYQHLVDEPLAASQMFNLLPQGLAYGGGYDVGRIQMYSIKPYDTISRLGYITSQAMVWYPTDGVSKLSQDIGYPTTALYNSPDSLVRNLTSQINPAIGIMPGSTLDGATGSTGGSGSDPSDTGSANNDPFDTQGPGEQTTSAQQGVTAGIAVGAASVAGAYGAAMFIIARRYKRKKQRHQRSSSINSPSEMRQAGSPALMGGALLSRDFTSNPGYGGVVGNTRDSQGSGRSGMNSSARTANISAPVAAENSLGWN
ncbi:uncharacterized protein GGS22DRAFT_66566 [Annulohypoxylon maeteangense]|uniref:uncharacterized protein n=1 Tax=Annulohypoxylon maeteangense TaxID=1927788 RepID=UPI002007DC37|nr:uncharacterized protein GGS22DRAFT_66566 [Annulohypoxylon maeteangense]KAI0889040.1 hypothetical protein GGS22DRAFT_66566 [Annulohypoxylon maeteangense]